MNTHFNVSGGMPGIVIVLIIVNLLIAVLFLLALFKLASAHQEISEALQIMLGFLPGEDKGLREGDAALFRKFLETDPSLACMNRQETISRFLEWRKSQRPDEGADS